MSFCLSCICCSSSVCSGHSACGSSSQLMSISGARYALHAHSTVHTYMQPANGRAPPKRVFKQMLLSCACYERMHTGPVMTPSQPRPREQLCRGGAAAARHSRQASIHHGHASKQAGDSSSVCACPAPSQELLSHQVPPENVRSSPDSASLSCTEAPRSAIAA